MKLGIYIHIPFCQKKCLYCDFPSYANLYHLNHDYINALCREIAGQGVRFSNAIVDTVYIGGGTPTTLTGDQIAGLLHCLRQHFAIAADAEISIEANPGTVDIGKLKNIAAAGINRISFGVQTFNDNLLAKIGRIHSAAQAVEAIALARAAGIANINVDLMYGLPGQGFDDFEHSLEQAIALKVPHISVYGLKVEQGTPFGDWQSQGLLSLPPEDIEEAMYDLTVSLLPDKGLCRYEISNYARLGYECRHNLKYWRYQPYLGLGAAAHSFIDGERFNNTDNILDYIVALTDNRSPLAEQEKVDMETAMAEYIFLALRMTAGFKFKDFFQSFGVEFREKFGTTVDLLTQRQLVLVTHDAICLTPLGMKYGNQVFAAFLPECT